MYSVFGGTSIEATGGSPKKSGRRDVRGVTIGAAGGVDRERDGRGPAGGAGGRGGHRVRAAAPCACATRGRRGGARTERGQRGRSRDPQHVGQVRGACGRVPERAQRGGRGVQAQDA